MIERVMIKQEEFLNIPNYQPTILVSNNFWGTAVYRPHQHLWEVSLAFSGPAPPPPADAAGFRTAWLVLECWSWKDLDWNQIKLKIILGYYIFSTGSL